MPTLLVSGGYRVYMVMADCIELEHVHVTGGRGAAKLWLEPTVKLGASRGYTATELRRIERIARARREELVRRWRQECGRVTG